MLRFFVLYIMVPIAVSVFLTHANEVRTSQTVMPPELIEATPPITYIENSWNKVILTDGDGNLYGYNKDYLIYHVLLNNKERFPMGTILIGAEE